MNIRVEKCFFDLNKTMNQWGHLSSAEVPYLVFGIKEELEVLEAVRNAAPATLENLRLDSVEIDERINETTFKVRALYVIDNFDGSTEDGEPEPSFAFDTGGGSKHINQSIETKGKFPTDAPDFAGTIEVDNDGNVNGIDITMPVMNFSETHYFRPGKVSTAYKKRLADLTGKINEGKFKGYDPGEVLFLGASGSRRGKSSKDEWEISFKFAVSPNVKNLKVGSLTIPAKEGWDYLWVRYENDVSEDEKSLIKKPIAAYVEQVYETRDFGGLGIGS